jgi:MATE family multidrug resistance protein
VQPILALWFNAERLLLALRQDPEVARLAALYLKYLSIELPAYAFNNTLRCVHTCLSYVGPDSDARTRRYFQAQGLFSVPTKIIIIAAPFNALLNYLLGMYIPYCLTLS